ncbi:Protein of unknown function [Pyronema omphalodes CBS 100304]|uniref:Uncharacterized protein n=1 Tax=Pyronema omphalodes (strain CBS 100304) TaxID=1076935 RepID=U4LUQ1_PYROM|nr:Protein of unknown function [Pyronema omphalodes CBS 100304]
MKSHYSNVLMILVVIISFYCFCVSAKGKVGKVQGGSDALPQVSHPNPVLCALVAISITGLAYIMGSG